jgi:hypothetical protein
MFNEAELKYILNDVNITHELYELISKAKQRLNAVYGKNYCDTDSVSKPNTEEAKKYYDAKKLEKWLQGHSELSFRRTGVRNAKITNTKIETEYNKVWLTMTLDSNAWGVQLSFDISRTQELFTTIGVTTYEALQGSCVRLYSEGGTVKAIGNIITDVWSYH